MMRMAKQVAEDNNPCYSRKVGVVITDVDGIIKGVGYNGPPRKTPHCDSAEYIREILLPKLNDEEKDRLVRAYNYDPGWKWDKEDQYDEIPRKLDGCKTCPRRLLGYSAGVRNDLCSCQHAERNAITNASASLKGGILYGWCCVSCMQCTGAVINARISECHFLDGPEYESGCLKLYEYAGIPIFLHSEAEIASALTKN